MNLGVSLQDDKIFHHSKAPIYSPFLKVKQSESAEAVKVFKLVSALLRLAVRICKCCGMQ